MSKTKSLDSRILGESKDNKGYTVFQNTDKNMVANIKSIKPSIDVFTMYNHENAKIVQELNEKQRLCLDEKGVYFVSDMSDILKTAGSNVLDSINNLYSVKDVIDNSLGELYSEDGYLKFVIRENREFEKNYDGLGRIGCSEYGVSLSDYNGIKLTIHNGKGGHLMFAHLNADGNIVNRDYNLDLKRYLNNTPKTKIDLIKDIIKSIPDMKYKRYGNKWFTDKFAYILTHTSEDEDDDENVIFRLAKLENNGGNKYGSRGDGNATLPKTAVDSSKDEILSIILPLVNAMDWGGDKIDLSKYCTVAVPNIKVAKPRVQKTKLKESEYSVINLIKNSDINSDKELMAALLNISNCIDIPENVDIVEDSIKDYLYDYLPSYSFDKGEAQENHDDYIALLKLPHGCNFTFEVEEGDCVEATWSHSIFQTDIVSFILVD